MKIETLEGIDLTAPDDGAATCKKWLKIGGLALGGAVVGGGIVYVVMTGQARKALELVVGNAEVDSRAIIDAVRHAYEQGAMHEIIRNTPDPPW